MRAVKILTQSDLIAGLMEEVAFMDFIEKQLDILDFIQMKIGLFLQRDLKSLQEVPLSLLATLP